jgi:hypothetical protein
LTETFAEFRLIDWLERGNVAPAEILRESDPRMQGAGKVSNKIRKRKTPTESASQMLDVN